MASLDGIALARGWPQELATRRFSMHNLPASSLLGTPDRSFLICTHLIGALSICHWIHMSRSVEADKVDSSMYEMSSRREWHYAKAVGRSFPRQRCQIGASAASCSKPLIETITADKIEVSWIKRYVGFQVGRTAASVLVVGRAVGLTTSLSVPRSLDSHFVL